MSDTDEPEVPIVPEPDVSASGDATSLSSASPTDRDDSAQPEPATPSGTRLTRRGRVRKWDQPPHPHDWRWYVGNVGKTLIATGLLMFAFVGYQLYGTGIENAAAQNRLEDEFEQQLAQFDPPAPVTDAQEDVAPDEPDDTEDVAEQQPADPVVVTDPPSTDSEPDVPTTEPAVEVVPVEAAVEVVPVEQQNIPFVSEGDALARLEMPAIGVNDIVVAGVDKTDLKKGPGHFPDTPLPGQLGNAAIAGHRTTFGQPFRDVDQLEVGDEIRVTTPNGVFVYLVTGQQIVSPSDYQVVATSDPTKATITLVSCHPVFTARERIIIFGELDRNASSAIGAPVINYGREIEPVASRELPGDDVAVDEPTGAIDDTDQSAPATTVPDDNDDTTTDDNDDTTAGTTVDAVTDDEADEPTGGEPVPDVPAGDPAPANDVDQLGSEQVNANIADAFSEGWFSDPAANSQVGLWGLVLAMVAGAAYAISRRFRSDLIGLAIGLIPFVLALYFFFQNVNRLLPPNL